VRKNRGTRAPKGSSISCSGRAQLRRWRLVWSRYPDTGDEQYSLFLIALRSCRRDGGICSAGATACDVPTLVQLDLVQSARLLAGWSLPHVSPLGGLYADEDWRTSGNLNHFPHFPLLRTGGLLPNALRSILGQGPIPGIVDSKNDGTMGAKLGWRDGASRTVQGNRIVHLPIISIYRRPPA